MVAAPRVWEAIHVWNEIQMQDGIIDGFLQRLFYDGVDVPDRLQSVLQTCYGHVRWFQMVCHKAKYQGYLAVCKGCGVCSMA